MNTTNTTTELVSIITPVYNCEAYIAETIQSVQAQTYSNWEMLLVDDCSPDRSAEIVRSFTNSDTRVKYIKLNDNSGAAVARNIALAAATGRYIAYLDSDDLWLPEKLERQIAFMEENGVAFTCCDYECINDDGASLGRVIHMPKRYTDKQLLKNHIILTVGVVADTRYIDKNLLTMPNVRAGQDTATWMQVLRSGVVFFGQNETLAKYRKVHKSLSSNRINAAKRTWNLYRNVWGFSALTTLWYMMFWTVHACRRRLFLPHIRRKKNESVASD